MKFRHYFLTVFLTLAVSTVYSQEEGKINRIKRTVEKINNDNSLTTKQLLNDFYVDKKNVITDNGQELKGYYKNGQLNKVIYTVGISCCMNTYEYYLTDGNLIFVYEKQETYTALTDSNGEFIDLDLELVFEGCYYFDHQKLIEIEKSGNKIFEEENSKEQKFLKDIKEHIQDLKYGK